MFSNKCKRVIGAKSKSVVLPTLAGGQVKQYGDFHFHTEERQIIIRPTYFILSVILTWLYDFVDRHSLYAVNTVCSCLFPVTRKTMSLSHTLAYGVTIEWHESLSADKSTMQTEQESISRWLEHSSNPAPWCRDFVREFVHVCFSASSLKSLDFWERDNCDSLSSNCVFINREEHCWIACDVSIVRNFKSYWGHFYSLAINDMITLGLDYQGKMNVLCFDTTQQWRGLSHCADELINLTAEYACLSPSRQDWQKGPRESFYVLAWVQYDCIEKVTSL